MIHRICAVTAKHESSVKEIVDFTKDALKMDNPFVTHKMILENEIVENLAWRKSVSNKEAMAFRERETAKIERMAIDCRLAGDVAKWFQNFDPAIKHMCRHVNGPLMEKLVLQINYRDAKCVDIFRDGAQIIGQLPDMGGERCRARQV